MLPKDSSLKSQRDRFLAFSFASSDLMLEVDEEGHVQYALGAAKGLVGVSDTEIVGRNWLDMFDRLDRPTLVAMRKKARNGARCGPVLVKLDEAFKGRQAVVTALKLPGQEQFFVTVAFPNVLMVRLGEVTRKHQNSTLLDRETFTEAAREALAVAKSIGQDVDMTLLDISQPAALKEQIGDDAWGRLTQDIAALLQAKSLDGQTAAQIGEGRYSVIHDKTIDSDALREQIAMLAQEGAPEGVEVEVSSKVVTADLQSLSERDTTKALVYTINEFERKGTALTIETLNTGFKAYVSANAQRIGQLKSIIQKLDFSIFFQPIVDLTTGEASHFEMLTRFADGTPPYEWVIFAEDVGMAPEFDLAVCERAINYLLYKSSGRNSKFAINVSGQSIQSDAFFKALQDKLKGRKDMSNRIMFEITESNTITDLDKVNGFIQILQRDGFKVCLDDFGAGSASFQYLNKLHVNYVKIDGQYTRRILESDRDAAMVKNLAQLCKDLNVKVVAEMIEEPEQAERLHHLGVQYGQGYLYSKALAKPEYTPLSQRGKEGPAGSE